MNIRTSCLILIYYCAYVVFICAYVKTVKMVKTYAPTHLQSVIVVHMSCAYAHIYIFLRRNAAKCNDTFRLFFLQISYCTFRRSSLHTTLKMKRKQQSIMQLFAKKRPLPPALPCPQTAPESAVASNTSASQAVVASVSTTSATEAAACTPTNSSSESTPPASATNVSGLLNCSAYEAAASAPTTSASSSVMTAYPAASVIASDSNSSSAEFIDLSSKF